MLRWNAVILLFFISTAGINAGEPLFVPHGAAAMGMAFSVTAVPGHWHCFNNQALLTSATGISVSADAEMRFMMPALSSKALSAIIATGPVPLGVIVTHYGNGDYYRVFAGLGSAITLSGKMSLGVQVDCITERGIGDYRDVTSLTFETGMTFTLSPSVTMGLHIFNPLASVNSLPSAISTGLMWKSSDDLLVTISSSKMTDEPLSLECGMRWNVLDRVILRSGYMSSPSSFAFGIGFRTGPMQADAGFLINNITGISSSLSLLWQIRR
jgi:hypothetical protein